MSEKNEKIVNNEPQYVVFKPDVMTNAVSIEDFLKMRGYYLDEIQKLLYIKYEPFREQMDKQDSEIEKLRGEVENRKAIISRCEELANERASLQSRVGVLEEALTIVRKGINHTAISYDQNMPPEEYGVTMALGCHFPLAKIDEALLSTQAEGDRSPIGCNHANEVPSVCGCDIDCYCKLNTCKESL